MDNQCPHCGYYAIGGVSELLVLRDKEGRSLPNRTSYRRDRCGTAWSTIRGTYDIDQKSIQVEKYPPPAVGKPIKIDERAVSENILANLSMPYLGQPEPFEIPIPSVEHDYVMVGGGPRVHGTGLKEAGPSPLKSLWRKITHGRTRR